MNAAWVLQDASPI